MSQRISDKEIADRLLEMETTAIGWGLPRSSVIGWRELSDLRDARAELARLKALSDSQEEAHAARDRGVSL